MNNNIFFNLRTFCKLLQKKTIYTELCAVTFFSSLKTKLQKLIFRHYWQMMSDILKTSYTGAIFEAAPRVFIILGLVSNKPYDMRY